MDLTDWQQTLRQWSLYSLLLYPSGLAGIEPITAAVTGALLGFLLFNVYPAQVFKWRYRISGTWRICAGAAYAEMPWIIPVVGLIYLVEVLSVMIRSPTLRRPAVNDSLRYL